MKVLVKRNYITVKGHLHGPGDMVDLADQEAKRFLASGQAEQVTVPKPAVNRKKAEKAAPTLPDPAPEALKRKK